MTLLDLKTEVEKMIELHGPDMEVRACDFYEPGYYPAQVVGPVPEKGFGYVMIESVDNATIPARP